MGGGSKAILFPILGLWPFVVPIRAVKTTTTTFSLSGSISTATGTPTGDIYAFRTPSVLPHSSELPISLSIPAKSIRWQFFLLFLILPIAAIVYVVSRCKTRRRVRQRTPGQSKTRTSQKKHAAPPTLAPIVLPTHIHTMTGWELDDFKGPPIITTCVLRKWDQGEALALSEDIVLGIKNYFIDLRILGPQTIDWAMAGTRRRELHKQSMILQGAALDSLDIRYETPAVIPEFFDPTRDADRPENEHTSYVNVPIPGTSLKRGYTEVWAVIPPTPYSRGGERISRAWILESAATKSGMRMFLGKIGGDYVAIAGRKGANRDDSKFEARWEKWNATSGRWEIKHGSHNPEVDHLPSLQHDRTIFDQEDTWREGQSDIDIRGRLFVVRALV